VLAVSSCIGSFCAYDLLSAVPVAQFLAVAIKWAALSLTFEGQVRWAALSCLTFEGQVRFLKLRKWAALSLTFEGQVRLAALSLTFEGQVRFLKLRHVG
jgi:hypothetical protein